MKKRIEKLPRSLYLPILAAFTAALFFVRPAYALIADDISAWVDIAVCGDHQAEGDEDCDWHDFDGAKCEDFGYAGGDLNCTIACEFDFSECISPTPTLTPSPTPITTTAPTPTTAESSSNSVSTTETSSSSQSESDNAKKNEQKKAEDDLFKLIKKNIPDSMSVFDADGDNQISYDEMESSVGNWVGSWDTAKTMVTYDSQKNTAVLPSPQDCDINNDGICNLVDFSILLYYIGR